MRTYYLGAFLSLLAPALALAQPAINLIQPKEGDKSVSGDLVGAEGAVAGIRVEVLSHDNRVLQLPGTSFDSTKRTFAAALPQPLATGQVVRARGVTAAGVLVDGVVASSTVLSSAFDWGRVRAYFSVGIVTAKGSDNKFSSGDAYVGLNIDYNLKTSQSYQMPRPVPGRLTVGQAAGILRDLNLWFLVEPTLGAPPVPPAPAVDSRRNLTSALLAGETIAVAELCEDLARLFDCTKPNPATVQTARAEFSKAGDLTRLADLTDAAKQAQPLTVEQITLFFRLLPPKFIFEGERDRICGDSALQQALIANNLSTGADLGDIKCGGFLINTYFEGRLTSIPTSPGTLTGSALQTPNSAYIEGGFYFPKYWSWSEWTFENKRNALYVAPLIKGGWVIPTAQTNSAPADVKDAFRFIGGGFRFGHMSLEPTPDVQPELLSYLDFTWGRWDNFRTIRPGVSPVGGSGYVYPIRFDVAGRFKIPQTPLFLGFGVNTGSGVDDVRFLFGSRFDLGKLLGGVIPRLGQ